MVFRKTTAAGCAALLALTACADGNFQDNQNQIGGVAIGALAGTILGGEIASDKSRGRALGAIVGGLAGAALGERLDAQERALKASQFGQSGAMIQNTGEQLVVTLPEQITFPFDSAEVLQRFRPSLATLAQNLNQFPNSAIRVVGHTDDVGSPAYNQSLSEQRALSVASVLVSNGVNGARISTQGAGEFSPVASNGSAAGRAQNRRVVITITPN